MAISIGDRFKCALDGKVYTVIAASPTINEDLRRYWLWYSHTKNACYSAAWINDNYERMPPEQKLRVGDRFSTVGQRDVYKVIGTHWNGVKWLVWYELPRNYASSGPTTCVCDEHALLQDIDNHYCIEDKKNEQTVK